MRMRAWVFAILAITVCAFSVSAETKRVKRVPAQTKPTAKSGAAKARTVGKTTAKPKGSFGVVVTPGAQVYEKPDLDAPVIAVVAEGVRLPISRGTRGEYAKFHRTRVKGKIGWITTIDVKPDHVAAKVLSEKRAEAMKPGPFAGDPKDDGEPKPGTKEPFAFSRSVAFAIGMADYKEAIAGQTRSANVLTYGLKIVGPDVLLTGPVMDVNIMMHYGAPDYYNELSSVKPSGFLLWTDANLLFPIRMREDHMIAVGAGPMLVLSNMQASQGAQNYSMFGLNIGATLEVLAGARLGDFTLFVDGKYIFEKKIYRQVTMSIGTAF